jgi:endoglycosylceramidase
MRRTGIGVACTLAMWAGVAACCAIPGQAGASGISAWKLGHAGRWLTDAQGRVVVTHGENVVAKVSPWATSAFGFGEDDAKFLVQNGFDTVRLGVLWAGVEPEPGVYDDAMLARVREVVEMLNRRHIGVILDSHQDMYNPRYQGDGFPNWSLNDEGLPNPQEGFPDNYFVNSALWRSFENFWANKPAPGDTVGVKDRFISAWQHIATYFANVPGVLGYEIINEPFPGSEWTTCADPEGCPLFDEKLSAFYRAVDHAIRAADPRTLVWYEPNVAFDFGANTHVSPLGRGSGFAFHDYCISGEENGCPTHEVTIKNAESFDATSGDALMMDEFGATGSKSDLETMVSLADQHMLPWMEWEYCACNETGTPYQSAQSLVYDESKPPSGANINRAVLEALVEPYPQLVAGTPLSWGFNREASTFTFRYGTRSADGTRTFRSGSVTNVATPKFSYPLGYAAHVSGGRLISIPGARIARVASCPGASEVAVTIAPGIAPAQGC